MSAATHDSTHSRNQTFPQIETAGRLSQRLGRRAALGLLFCGLLWLCGCATAFDGGTIPGGIGGSRAVRVFGQVVSAANPIQAIPNTLVSITTAAPGSRAASQPVQMLTDANGDFDLANVIITGRVSQVQVTLTPNDPSFRPETITFTLTGQQPADLLAALVPAAMQNTGTRVTLSPAGAIVPVNTPLPLKAQVFDAQSNLQPLLPNLLYVGSSGTLNSTGFSADGSDATFLPLTTGTGTLTALWNGASSPLVPIQVTPKPPGQPPAPPISTPHTEALRPSLPRG